MSAAYETCCAYFVKGELAIIDYAAQFPFATALARAFVEAL